MVKIVYAIHMLYVINILNNSSVARLWVIPLLFMNFNILIIELQLIYWFMKYN